MIFVWMLVAGIILIPFFAGVYAGYKGEPYERRPSRYSPSDDENIKTVLLKSQVDILDKNRRESWTNPTYFKK